MEKRRSQIANIEDSLGSGGGAGGAGGSGVFQHHHRRDGSIISHTGSVYGGGAEKAPLSRRCSRHSHHSKRSSLGSQHGGSISAAAAAAAVTTTTADVLVAGEVSPGKDMGSRSWPPTTHPQLTPFVALGRRPSLDPAVPGRRDSFRWDVLKKHWQSVRKVLVLHPVHLQSQAWGWLEHLVD